MAILVNYTCKSFIKLTSGNKFFTSFVMSFNDTHLRKTPRRW